MNRDEGRYKEGEIQHMKSVKYKERKRGLEKQIGGSVRGQRDQRWERESNTIETENNLLIGGHAITCYTICCPSTVTLQHRTDGRYLMNRYSSL